MGMGDWLWLFRFVREFSAEQDRKRKQAEEDKQAEQERTLKQVKEEREQAEQQRAEEYERKARMEHYSLYGGAIDIAMQARKERLKFPEGKPRKRPR